MKKKTNKKKKFKEVYIDINYEPKKSIEVIKQLKNISGDKIISYADISFIIIRQKNYEKKVNSFSIYNKDNLTLIQSISNTDFDQCFPLNEEFILFSNENNLTEIWKKNENIFIRYKSFNFSINSNILFNSKFNIFFHSIINKDNEYKSEIQIWETENKLPISKLKTFYMDFSKEKEIFFMNYEKILVIYNCIVDFDAYSQHETNLGIAFYDMDNLKNIKNFELDNKYCDLKPIKLDENRIIIIEKISDDCSYDEDIKQNVKIMTIPDFKLVKEFEPDFPITDVLIYKEYFIFYESMVKIYNSQNFQLIEEINIRGIYSLIYLKDNYFIGLVNQYITDKNDFSNEKKNQIRDLIVYEINI